MFAKILDKKIDKYPYNETDLKLDHPSTSFPKNPLLNADLREAFSIVEVKEKTKPDFNKQTQKCIEKNPVLNNNVWSQTWETKTKTSNEKINEDLKQWKNIRNQRNQKLSETDWLMVKALETGEDASDLRTYRQKLRDIPQTQTNPFLINWPKN